MKEQEKKEEMTIFDGFGAYVIAKDYIQSGYEFCPTAQVKFFTLEDDIAEELAILHLSQGFSLSDEAQKEMFKLPQERAERIVIKMLEQGFNLNEEILPQIAELPQGNIILESYYLSSDRVFSDEAQKLLITLPKLKETAQKFIHMNKKAPHRLSPELQDYAQKHGWLRTPMQKVN